MQSSLLIVTMSDCIVIRQDMNGLWSLHMMEAHVRSFIGTPTGIHFIISAGNTLLSLQRSNIYKDMICGIAGNVLEADAETYS